MLSGFAMRRYSKEAKEGEPSGLPDERIGSERTQGGASLA